MSIIRLQQRLSINTILTDTRTAEVFMCMNVFVAQVIFRILCVGYLQCPMVSNHDFQDVELPRKSRRKRYIYHFLNINIYGLGQN